MNQTVVPSSVYEEGRRGGVQKREGGLELKPFIESASLIKGGGLSLLSRRRPCRRSIRLDSVTKKTSCFFALANHSRRSLTFESHLQLIAK